ncbi:MAG: CotH kinase family protein [Planctomycetes bacterium]|nr:CotH kinase family protein [Planctomycetota bacterium]
MTFSRCAFLPLLLLNACEEGEAVSCWTTTGRCHRDRRGRARAKASRDTDTDTDTADGIESVPGTGGSGYDGTESADLYTLDRVISLDITLPDASVRALNADPYTYVEASITIDGETLDQVGIRIGGKYGSYRALSGKSGFKIDIDRYDNTQKWRGLERLVVKNMVQDYSFMHEYIAFQVYEAMGVPAPRVGYLWVTVNGEDYGLYSNVEALDDRFLARHFAEPTGNLYDGDYWLAATGAPTSSWTSTPPPRT